MATDQRKPKTETYIQIKIDRALDARIEALLPYSYQGDKKAGRRMEYVAMRWLEVMERNASPAAPAE